jgi:phage host-nuclease inhibitor protein Gam
LTDYARRERATSGRKTIDLPHGKIKSRAAQPKYLFTDPAAFIAWAKETGHPDLVRVKEEPDLTAVKAVLQVPQMDEGRESAAAFIVDPASGEVAPGVEVELRGATYAVEVAL